MIQGIQKLIRGVMENKSLKQKILFTVGMLAIYRLLIFIPVPFVDITALMSKTASSATSGLSYFVMLLG
jgi:preprotein translocase subunit SecY